MGVGGVSNSRSDVGDQIAAERLSKSRLRYISCLRAVGGAADRPASGASRSQKCFACDVERRHAFDLLAYFMKWFQAPKFKVECRVSVSSLRNLGELCVFAVNKL